MSYFPLRISDEVSNISVPPLTPDALDDEFDGWALDPAWDDEGSVSGSLPNALASFNTGDMRRQVGYRRSHLRLQNSADSTERGISKDVGGGGVAVDGFYWCRAVGMAGGHAVNNNGNTIFQLAATSGGLIDPDERIQIFVVEDNGGPVTVQARVINGGVVSTVFTSQSYGGEGKYWEFFGILKTGATSYIALAAERNGAWDILGNTTINYTGGATIDRVGFTQINTTTTGFNKISLIDFFRYKAVDIP